MNAKDIETTKVIEQIVKNRKIHLEKIRGVGERLAGLTSQLRALEGDYNARLKPTDKIAPETLNKVWAGGSPAGLLAQSKDQLDKITSICTRFEREWINIAVTGRHRTGKSQLLRAITGLGSAEIPTASLDSLTASVSTLVFEDIDLPHAKVEFHNRTTFLEEVIKGYFEALDLAGYERFLDDNFSLPLPSDASLANAAKGLYYKRLKAYHKQRPQYIKNLTGGTKDFYKANESDYEWILPYIAWYDPSNPPPAAAGGEWNVQFTQPMAVKSVEIYCRFKNLSVEGIRLIDMPGLGELRAGLEETLKTAIREQADMTLFVIRPDPMAAVLDEPITKTHGIIADAIDPVRPEKSVLVVLNNVRTPQGGPVVGNGFGDNTINCGRLLPTVQHNLSAARHEIVDCAGEAAVRGLLDTVLEVLRANLHDIDTIYMNDRLASVGDFANQVEGYLRALKRVIDGEMPQHGDAGMKHEVLEFHFNQLCAELDATLKTLYGKINVVDADVDKALQATREKIKDEKLLPTAEDVRRFDVQANRQGAYAYHRKRIRANIWQYFEVFANAGNVAIEKAKLSIADTLQKHAHLSELTGQKQGLEFLAAAGDLLGEPLSEALYEFESYQHTLKHLEYHLYRTLPVMADEPQDVTPFKGDGDVVLRLRDDCQKSAKNLQSPYLEEMLNKLVLEPNCVAFAISRKFYDKAFFAAGAKNAWTGFWTTHRDVIWQKEFGSAKRTRQYLDALQRNTAEALQAAQSLKPFVG